MEPKATMDIGRRGWTVLLLAGLAGCQEWMATPVRVQRDYGESVRTAYLDEIYDPGRARHPAAYAPDGTADSIRPVKVLQRAYQGDIGSPQRVRQQSQITVGGSGGSGGGSSGGGGSGGQ